MRIPFESKSDTGRPLKDVLLRTASECGYTHYEVARVMTFFLEHLADEVTAGKVVRIPGFGAFGAWLIETASALARDPRPRCRPVFSPARGFQEQVRYAAPPNRGPKERLMRHRRNHAPATHRDRSHSRVFTSMDAFRRMLSVEAGIDLSEIEPCPADTVSLRSLRLDSA
jgi:nucleoid DNA-binding protein